MGTYIARYLMATLNFLVGLLYTGLWIFIAWQGNFRHTSANAATVFIGVVLSVVLTIAPVVVGTLLLRQRTVAAGLRGHFALANLGLILLVYTAINFASRHAQPHLSSWDLNQLKWVAALCGLWFGTGLTLKLLLENKAEQSNSLPQVVWDTEQCQRQADQITPLLLTTSTTTRTDPALLTLGQRR